MANRRVAIVGVALSDTGRVDTRTILTYGQSEDPTSPWSKDQTRLFGQGKWVHFPWTRSQIRRQLVDRVVVRG